MSPLQSFSVTLQDIAKLIKAISTGKLYLTLKNGKDYIPVATVEVISMFPGTPGSKKLALMSLLSLPSIPEIESSLRWRYGSRQSLPIPIYEIELWKSDAKDIIQVPSG